MPVSSLFHLLTLTLQMQTKSWIFAVGVFIKMSCCFTDNGKEMHQSSCNLCRTTKSFNVQKYLSRNHIAACPGIKFLHISKLNSYILRGLEMERKNHKFSLKCFYARHSRKTCHYNVVKDGNGCEMFRMINARAWKHAKLLFFMIKYANLWHSSRRGREVVLGLTRICCPSKNMRTYTIPECQQ